MTRLTYESHAALERLTKVLGDALVDRLHERGVRAKRSQLAAARSDRRAAQSRVEAIPYPAAAHKRALEQREQAVQAVQKDLDRAIELSKRDHRGLYLMVGALAKLQAELRSGVLMPPMKGLTLARERSRARKEAASRTKGRGSRGAGAREQLRR